MTFSSKNGDIFLEVDGLNRSRRVEERPVAHACSRAPAFSQGGSRPYPAEV